MKNINSIILKKLKEILVNAVEIIRFVPEMGRGRTPWVHFVTNQNRRLATFLKKKHFRGMAIAPKQESTPSAPTPFSDLSEEKCTSSGEDQLKKSFNLRKKGCILKRRLENDPVIKAFEQIAAIVTGKQEQTLAKALESQNFEYQIRYLYKGVEWRLVKRTKSYLTFVSDSIAEIVKKKRKVNNVGEYIEMPYGGILSVANKIV